MSAVLMVVTERMAAALTPQLDILERDLQAARWTGWKLLTCSEKQTPESVRGAMLRRRETFPFDHALLVGRVPRFLSMDDPDRHATRLVPSDWPYCLGGKVAVGRVDLSGMGRDEVALQRVYWAHNHAYRAGVWNPARRSLLIDYFSETRAVPVYAAGMMRYNASQLTPGPRAIVAYGRDAEGRWQMGQALHVSGVDAQGFWYAGVQGPGGLDPADAAAYSTSTQMMAAKLNVVVSELFASGAVGWDRDRAPLRAPLCCPTPVLASIYPYYTGVDLAGLLTGQTVGQAVTATLMRYASRWQALMGDPTLRLRGAATVGPRPERGRRADRLGGASAGGA